MSSLLSSQEKAKINEAFEDFFDTFKRTITVHKGGKRAVNDIDTSFLLGYGEISNNTNYQHVLENKTFNAIVWFPQGGDQDNVLAKEISAWLPDGQIRIKVKADAKDYIKQGKTERIDLEGHSYMVLGEEANINSIIDGYYMFKLGEIK
jgi:hypothetical protein